MLHTCVEKFDVMDKNQNFLKLRACLDSKKFCAVPITSNLTTHAWSTKCRRKKLIAQLGEKSRDETFKPN